MFTNEEVGNRIGCLRDRIPNMSCQDVLVSLAPLGHPAPGGSLTSHFVSADDELSTADSTADANGGGPVAICRHGCPWRGSTSTARVTLCPPYAMEWASGGVHLCRPSGGRAPLPAEHA
jgi:hypothetical protein